MGEARKYKFLYRSENSLKIPRTKMFRGTQLKPNSDRHKKRRLFRVTHLKLLKACWQVCYDPLVIIS